MASLLNDDVRRERYAVLRMQRIKCEKCFSRCGALLVGIGAADIISTLYMAIWTAYSNATNHALAEWVPNIICLPISLAVYVTVLVGVHMRKRVPLHIAMCLSFALMFMRLVSFSTVAIVPIVLCWLSMQKWEELSMEEGFPQFDIGFDERAKRAAQMERITKHTAIENGQRRTAAPDADAMSDLLDEAGDIPIATAELTEYHDRSRHGRIEESGKAVEYGNMDEL